MKTITTKSGQKFVLMPEEYLETIQMNEPMPGFFSKNAKIHLHNCGWIICYPEKNNYFDMYEPTDNEYFEEDAYQEIEANRIIEECRTFRKNLRTIFENAEIDALDDDTKGILEDIVEIAKDHAFEMSTNWYGSQVRTDYHVPEYSRSSIKMSQYKEKGSDPERIANSCKDLTKVCCRLLWCIENWPEAVDAFKERAKDLYFEINKNLILRKGAEAKRKRLEKEEAARKFEEDVNNADSEKYAPTARDWQKMIDYRNRKSDPTRLAQSCKDNNKVVARAIIAKALGWEAAAAEFRKRALELGILTAAELEAYTRKYANYNVPQEYQEMIDAIKVTDTKGGLAKVDLTEENDMEQRLPKKLIKWLDDNFDIKDYSITRSEKADARISHRTYSDYARSYTIHIIKFDETELDVPFVIWKNGYATDTHVSSYEITTLDSCLLRIQRKIDNAK